jgi:hypothetical protein
MGKFQFECMLTAFFVILFMGDLVTGIAPTWEMWMCGIAAIISAFFAFVQWTRSNKDSGQ